MDLEITASKSNVSDKNDISNNSSKLTSKPNSKSGMSDFPNNESVPSSNPGCSHIKSDTLDAGEDLNLKHAQNDISDSDTKNLPSQNVTNCYSSENKSLHIKLSSEAINSDNNDLETSKNIIPSNEEIVPAIVPNTNFCDGEKLETELLKRNEEVVSLNLTPTKTEADLCNLKNNQDFPTKSEKDVEKYQEHCNIYSSTPVVLNSHTSSENNQTPKLSNTSDFGKMSPLDALCKKNKKDLKRKFLNLQCIEEVNEDNFDFSGEKKLKSNVEDHVIPHSERENEENISSSTAPTCLEAPAKSILKKWQTSSFSRISGTSYYIMDECGECDEEETQDAESNASSSAPADEFEIACNSLNEELMKGGSFNIEGLEKYYSKVQLETQIDHETFDEVLQELTFEIDDRKTLPVVSVAENKATKSHTTSTAVKNIEVNDCDLEKDKNMIQYDNEINTPKNKIVQNNMNSDCDSESEPKVIVKVKDNIEIDEVEKPNSIGSALGADESVVHNNDKNMTIIYADGEDLAKDEEDVLLEEDTNTKTKPYVFFEFVSSDPKENEDNYNPEWQKLGRLTTDEERYKAVRDRWRSLVPPDPNRDLTCRQWREKNKKPPLNLSSRNNNRHMRTNNKRNQLCTAVFEMKIKKIMNDLDEGRMHIFRKRTMDFEDLAATQDREQSMMAMMGHSEMELARLRKQHILECCQLRDLHDREFDKITRITEEQIRILKDASEEVLLFQNFYKGVGSAADDKVCIYMTDLQVQELMETEDMLEKYTKFYK